MMVKIEDQIACVARELAMRRNVYKKWIASGRMKQADADREIEHMEAVLATVKDVQLYQSLVVALNISPDEVAAVLNRLLKAQQ